MAVRAQFLGGAQQHPVALLRGHRAPGAHPVNRERKRFSNIFRARPANFGQHFLGSRVDQVIGFAPPGTDGAIEEQAGHSTCFEG